MAGVSHSYTLLIFPMEPDSADNSAEPRSVINTRYSGKVQFLRFEHGYIRTKAKIRGLRDITFYYSSLPEALKTLLTQGTEVTFTLKDDEGGKFSAENIEIEGLDTSISLPASSSNQSQIDSSSELPSSEDELSCDSSLDKPQRGLSPAAMQFRRPSSSSSSSSSSSANTTSQMSLCPSSCLTERVDSLLVQVISRKFSSLSNSCWDL